MGAVFGIIAGYYYWSPKILGYKYDEKLSRIHFWLIFIGVNTTFFPMHFIGLNGMPRRIPMYPDSYKNWNEIITYGSIVSFISLILFLYIIYKQLSEKIPFKNYIVHEYFYSSKMKENNSLTIEFVLNSIPDYHHFKQLPVL